MSMTYVYGMLIQIKQYVKEIHTYYTVKLECYQAQIKRKESVAEHTLDLYAINNTVWQSTQLKAMTMTMFLFYINILELCNINKLGNRIY